MATLFWLLSFHLRYDSSTFCSTTRSFNSLSNREQNNVRHDAMWYWRVKEASDRLAAAKVMNPAIKRLFEVEVLLPALFHPRERNALFTCK